MFKIGTFSVLVALVAVSLAYPFEGDQYYPEEAYEIDAPAALAYQETYRLKRSLQPGAPGFPNPSQQNGGWAVNPNIGRDERGNTRVDTTIQHTGKNHEVNAGWGKVVRGPGKSKPTWNVGGTYRW